jgi:hypothetical protein
MSTCLPSYIINYFISVDIRLGEREECLALIGILIYSSYIKEHGIDKYRYYDLNFPTY